MSNELLFGMGLENPISNQPDSGSAPTGSFANAPTTQVPNSEMDFMQFLTPELNPTQGQTIDTGLLAPNEMLIGQTRFKVDERYIGLVKDNPVDAVYRTMQSNYDKVNNEHLTLKQNYEKVKSLAAITETLVSDETFARAFINEKFPGLLPEVNLEDRILSELEKEFGKDFQYDPDESRNPLSKSAKWLRKYQSLEDKYSKDQTEKVGSLKEYMQKRQVEEQQQALEFQQRQAKLVEKHRFSPQEFQHYQAFLKQAVSNEDMLVGLFRMLMTRTSTASNAIPSVGATHPVGDTMKSQVDNFFAQNGM